MSKSDPSHNGSKITYLTWNADNAGVSVQGILPFFMTPYLYSFQVCMLFDSPWLVVNHPMFRFWSFWTKKAYHQKLNAEVHLRPSLMYVSKCLDPSWKSRSPSLKYSSNNHHPPLLPCHCLGQLPSDPSACFLYSSRWQWLGPSHCRYLGHHPRVLLGAGWNRGSPPHLPQIKRPGDFLIYDIGI